MFVCNFDERDVAHAVVPIERLALVSTKHRNDKLGVAEERNTFADSMAYVRLTNISVKHFQNVRSTIGKLTCVVRKNSGCNRNVITATASVNARRTTKPFHCDEKRALQRTSLSCLFFLFFYSIIIVNGETSREA